MTIWAKCSILSSRERATNSIIKIDSENSDIKAACIQRKIQQGRFMQIIKGKYNQAKCFCDTIEDKARQQIQALCDNSDFSDSKIRIMPDVHAGVGCTIGTTMTIKDKVTPSMVGVDIGCGMEVVKLQERKIDFKLLDNVIRSHVPSGRNVRNKVHEYADNINLDELNAAHAIDASRARHSIGTLGGGNHFIEVDRASDGTLYLVIHSGSRHLGTEIATHYQSLAYESVVGRLLRQKEQYIETLKAEGRAKEIEKAIRDLPFADSSERNSSACSGSLMDDYINDMKITQKFAVVNRRAIVDEILKNAGLTQVSSFTTIHNYIDTDAMVLRKGAVSAHKGEKLLIPINMRDGSLICRGLGNPDWNESAPHGAGRLMSRSAATKKLSMSDYRKSMEGIYTTCVSKATIDESPMAYKSIDSIIKNIDKTVTVQQIIKPVYNYKASE